MIKSIKSSGGNQTFCPKNYLCDFPYVRITDRADSLGTYLGVIPALARSRRKFTHFNRRYISSVNLRLTNVLCFAASVLNHWLHILDRDNLPWRL